METGIFSKSSFVVWVICLPWAGMFKVTLCTPGVIVSLAVLNDTRYCRYLPTGDIIALPLFWALHTLHVSSGFRVLPVLVSTFNAVPAGVVASQDKTAFSDEATS